MEKNLTKMVEDWHTQSVREYDSAHGRTNKIREYSQLRYILRDLVDEIEGNREEIERLDKSFDALWEKVTGLKIDTVDINLKAERGK